MTDRLKIKIEGPQPNASAFAEHLIDALGQQPMTWLYPRRELAWDRTAAIAGFHAADDKGEETRLGQFMGIEVMLRTADSAPKAGDPVEPPFGCAPTMLTFEPFTGKHGDQVRVSFTAMLTDGEGSPDKPWLSHNHVKSLTNRFTDLTVELLDRQLVVGDLVIWLKATGKVSARSNRSTPKPTKPGSAGRTSTTSATILPSA